MLKPNKLGSEGKDNSLKELFNDMCSYQHVQDKIDETNSNRFSFKFCSDQQPMGKDNNNAQPESLSVNLSANFVESSFCASKNSSVGSKVVSAFDSKKQTSKWGRITDIPANKQSLQHAEMRRPQEPKPRMSLAGLEKGFSFFMPLHNSKDSPFTSVSGSSASDFL